MQNLPTQLAIPGQYTPLARNIVAPSLRKQIHSENKILHTHKSILNAAAFRENEFTSKAGGLPCWLPPSPLESSSSSGPPPPSSVLPFKQPIPFCPGCQSSMMLITQIFSPIDFITDLSNHDPNVPILSCYTSSVIKKAASAINLNSTAPDTLITVSRHARSIYVFACVHGTCSYNPGAWKTLSLVQSAPKNLTFSPTGSIIFKKPINNNAAAYYDNSTNDDHTDEYVDYSDEDDEDYEAHYPEDDEAGSLDIDATPPQTSPPIQIVQPTAPKPLKVQDTFSMGGWSDDDNNDSDSKSDSSQTTFSQLQEMVSQTRAIQMKASGKSEKQLKVDIEKAKLLKKRKARGAKAHIPVIIEPKIDHSNADNLDMVAYKDKNGDDGSVSKATANDILFFRPFYLWWQGEDATTLKNDYSKEKQLLKEYYTQRDSQEGEPLNNESQGLDDDDGEPTSLSPSNFLDEDEEHDDEEQDPYELYQDAINNQPEQVIRYFNSDLSLHTQPGADHINKFRKSAKQHAMQRYIEQSGVWLLHDVPKCKCCQETLTLEFQILPTLLSELRPDEFELVYHKSRFDANNAPVKLTVGQTETKNTPPPDKRFDFDWGLVNIYSCLNMCNPDEYMTGFCLVQPGI